MTFFLQNDDYLNYSSNVPFDNMSHVLQQLMNKYKKNTTIQYNTKVYYIKYTYTALQANKHIYNL